MLNSPVTCVIYYMRMRTGVGESMPVGSLVICCIVPLLAPASDRFSSDAWSFGVKSAPAGVCVLSRLNGPLYMLEG